MRKEVNVKDYIKDDAKIMTSCIQEAINSLDDGGIVYFPKGVYTTGTFYLKSDITLYLDNGAKIISSNTLDDYDSNHEGAIEAPSFSHCLIYAENAENIEIMGDGVIDGNGACFDGDRPMLMRFVNCRNIRFEKIHLRNAAAWCVHMIDCSDININKVDLYNRVQYNNDGFDFDSCKNVFISDSKIISGDDSICLKNTKKHVGENFVITNCILSSHTAVFKTGTSSLTGYKNITISNCVFQDCPMGTIKIISVDGGVIENINISNIIMDRVGSPLFIRLGKRNMKFEKPEEMDYETKGTANDGAVGKIRNISISNIRADVTVTEKDKTPIMITGLLESKVENIHISNVSVSFPGGGTEEDKQRVIDEDEYRYPEQWFFGVLPSYAVFARHTKGLKLDNVEFTLKSPDARDAFLLEDTEDCKL